MSNNNQKQVKPAALAKYAFILGLLLFAPLALLNQIWLPILGV